MVNLGFFELTIFGIIALIVLGPEKLPVAARTLGRWYGMFRRASSRLQSEINSQLQLLETQEQLKAELDKIKATEHQMKTQMDQLQHSLRQTQQTLDRQTKHNLDAWYTFPDPPENTPSDQTDNPSQTTTSFGTMPLTNRWFLLSDYDRKRRLPNAPFLPNYQADPLLTAHR